MGTIGGRGVHRNRGDADAVTTWFDEVSAEVAERRGDWATAIAIVREFAECYRHEPNRHDAHLWHMDLLARAGRLRGLVDQAKIDVHARRRLDRLLYVEGRDAELRERIQCGDKIAVYLLVRLLRDRGGHGAAIQAVVDIDRNDAHAIELAHRPPANG